MQYFLLFVKFLMQYTILLTKYFFLLNNNNEDICIFNIKFQGYEIIYIYIQEIFNSLI